MAFSGNIREIVEVALRSLPHRTFKPGAAEAAIRAAEMEDNALDAIDAIKWTLREYEVIDAAGWAEAAF